MKENIKAIFLDLGGTFREVDETNRPFIRQARERICELCGINPDGPLQNTQGKKMTILPPQSKEGRLREIYL